MDDTREMILADALQTAIEQTKKNIKQRRIIMALSVICGVLAFLHIVR